MVDHCADLLGPTKTVAECEVCGDTIRLPGDDHWVFAYGGPEAVETHYRLAALCSPDCVETFTDRVLAEPTSPFRPGETQRRA